MKAKQIQLEGMGLMGSLVAHLLEEHGVPFRWYDTESEHTGWKACTGVIYPGGTEEDWKSYQWWLDQALAGEESNLALHSCTARWCYISKHPPHKAAKLGVTAGGPNLPGLTVASHQSVHFNAQRFVEMTRERFRGARVDGADNRLTTLVTHGFDKRFVRGYSHGWTAKVEVVAQTTAAANWLELDPAAFYLRSGLDIAYCYPVPLTGLWYAGTHLITYPVIRPTKEVSLVRWLAKANGRLRKTGLHIEARGPVVTGWRPIPKDPDGPIVFADGAGNKRFQLKPQYGAALRSWGNTRKAVEQWLAR